MSTSMLLGNPMSEDEEGSEDDEDAVDLMGFNSNSDDSSEEEDDDSEAEREVRKDFIVDDDEAAASSRRRRKKKRRKQRSNNRGSGEEQDDDQDAAADKSDDDGEKERGSSKKRRKDSDGDDDLDEDDLALLEENTGVRLTNRGQKPGKLKRLRRRRSVDAGSEDGSAAGLNNLFDDDERGIIDDDEEDDGGLPFDGDEMAGFIEDDTASESDRQAGSDEDEGDRSARRDAKRKARMQQKKTKRGRGFGPAYIDGITAEAWQEVTEVFGNGQDYAWAMDDDEEEPKRKELKDLFEPSEIASRMLTEADEQIRIIDIPERMQISSVGLPTIEDGDEEVGITYRFLSEEDLDAAAEWMSTRISARASEHFVVKDVNGDPSPYYEPFLDAVKHVVKFINIDLLEVPFIWAHRADYLVYRGPNDIRDEALLDHNDLWRVSSLSVKYRSLVYRKKELKNLIDQMEVEDDYFDELLESIDTVEEASDVTDWLKTKYASQLEQLTEVRERESDNRPRRRATRDSAYQTAKKDLVSKLASSISISASDLSKDFLTGTRSTTIDDPLERPLELAETYTGENYKTPQQALAAATLIAVHEIFHDPGIRREMRKYFKEHAVISVTPTDKGVGAIDEMNPFYAFKYLKERPISTLLRSPMYLQIISAEQQDLAKSRITLPERSLRRFLDDLSRVYKTDYASSLAEEWNKIRSEILETVVKEHLLPFGERWVRGYLREEEEEYISRLCKNKLEDRINVAPYCRQDKSMDYGEIPSVLAISNGEGNPTRDSVICVFLDNEGHIREQLKVDNLHAMIPDQQQSLTDLLRRRRPQVVVVGGFSPKTNRLLSDFIQFAQGVSDEIVHDEDDLKTQDLAEEPYTTEELTARAKFETIYVHDNVARLYQTSPRALIEFPELSTLARYCVGLARYAQSPLNEYAALGDDLVALTYDPAQNYVPVAKIKESLEKALIEVVNRAGVDINRAVRNAYYRVLLPYIAGLGPRKASGLIKKIEANVGGTLSNRSGLITHLIMTKNVFMNAAGFLRISQDDLNADLGRREAAGDEPEVLDETRIHPEDYEVARKMAADAMEVDEEETASFKTPSQAVLNLMEGESHRLDDLSLDDFARELQKLLKVPKRLTLYAIRDELQNPYADRRPPFAVPTHAEVFAMLTGETRLTLDNGLIIPVKVVRFRNEGSIQVRLESEIEGTIEADYRTERPDTWQKPSIGQTIQAQVIAINLETFTVELSTQETAIATGDASQRRVAYDPTYYDIEAANAERERQTIVEKKASGRKKRLINHPNFQNFSAGQAEEYLSGGQRGDCVIRPSSIEDHITVTWKVADGVFQHIAVHELNKPNDFALGTLLRITKPLDTTQPALNRGEAYWSYTDLDEIIFNHVKAMAAKVEELMAHEKFRGTKPELEKHLSLLLNANPNQSAYGFAINNDPKKAGLFMVSFRANDRSSSYSWPIWIVPGGFILKNAEFGSVAQLCNGFKIAYQAEIASGSAGAARLPGRTPRHAGGMTPFGAGAAASGSRTPFRDQRALEAIQGAGGGNMGRTTPLFASGRTPMLAAGSGATPNGGGRSSHYASGKTPLDPRQSGRTPNPFALNQSGSTPLYNTTAAAAGSGRTPAYGSHPGSGPAAGGRTPAYQAHGTGYPGGSNRWGQ